MTRGFAAIEECRRAGSHDSHFGLSRRLGPERKGGVTMKHLRTACVALAFVATTVSGSAQTSLTPSQNTTNSRTIIPQPAPVMRERIVNPSAGSDIGLGAAEQPPTQNNVFVNGALAVPGAPANTDTVPQNSLRRTPPPTSSLPSPTPSRRSPPDGALPGIV